MLTNLRRKSLAIAMTVLLGGVTTVSFAAGRSAAVDLGPTHAGRTVDATLILALHDQDALERYIYSTVDPGSPNFHQFLTTAQFAQRYGATSGQIGKVQAFLNQQGLHRVEVLPNHLAIKVRGTVGQFNAAFRTSIHDYRDSNGATFHRPDMTPAIPAMLWDTVVATTGLNSQARYRSHRVDAAFARQQAANAKAQAISPATVSCSGNATATCTPGHYTVGDVANRYNVNPLYKRGINGKGSTIGIATLANFVPADAYAYWNLIGLPVKANRITQVHVDGGGALSGSAGSGETSLDVEQSGGLAPQANIIVYDAPNSDAGFFDVFNRAVSDNQVDSLSVSWGSPEIFYLPQLNGGVDFTGELRAFHQVFLEAAAQGISMFASSGDSGAYDTVRSLGGLPTDAVPPPLSVDAPSADPYITSAGGTTVPFTFSFSGGPVASLPTEGVWGWSYIAQYFQTNLAFDITSQIFAVGGGGGVSVIWPVPAYQQFTAGIRTSEANQTLFAPNFGINYTLPAHYAGRNQPDVSLNADPETGYSVVSSTDGGLQTFVGGTSFVAPQLNGISALLRQSSHGRLGLWNPRVYALQNVLGHTQGSPFHDIRSGDNWFYQGIGGFEPGAGVGTLDVSRLAALFNGL